MSKIRVPITAAIIALNEERYLERCLRALTWADEILVIDGGSTDRTGEICQAKDALWSPSVRFLTRPWTGFREQRNFALAQAKNDWILVVDADEECSTELRDKITSLMNQPEGPPHRAYKVRRTEFFLGKPIHFGIWNPSYQDRFFHRQGVQYINDIHEYPRFAVEPLRIHEPLMHAPDFSVERFLDKMNRYTTIEARDRFARGQRTNFFRILFAFPAMFFKNYFYYAAYKDGAHGFVISILEGVSRAVRHVKLWQHAKRARSDSQAP